MQNFKRIVIVFCLSMLFAVARSATDNFVSNNPYLPRVISDLEIIYGSHGIKVNFLDYNETTSPNATHLVSVPGCPLSIDGFPWIYYGNPPRCFLAEHKGPCPRNQKLFLQRGSPYGICACECLANEKSMKEMSDSQIQYIFCQGTKDDSHEYGQLYDKKNKECYNLFETGPCSVGEVMTKYTNHSINCQPLCDMHKAGWNEDYKTEKCALLPRFGNGSGASGILTGDCPSGQRYSDNLKKCIRSLLLTI